MTPAGHPLTRRRVVVAGASGIVAGLASQVLAPADARAQAAMPASSAATPALRWHNWSGLQQAQPNALPTPASEGELAALLAGTQGELRPVGSGHSFSALVPTSGVIVSLDRLSGLVSVDKQAMTATVLAGTRLGVLARALDAQGLALRNLPDVDAQAIAGAIATGTHGTGATLPALHADVTALRLVTPDGQVLTLDERRDADALAAARVSLGCLGIVSQLTLRVVPAYNLQRKVWLQPVQDLLRDAPALAAKHRHFELFVLPFTGYAAAVTHDLYEGSDLALPISADDAVLADLRRLRDWLGHFPRLRTWAAQRLIDPNQTEHARHRAHRMLTSVRPVRFNETEWHVPAERGIECLRQVLAAIETHDEAFFPIEFRWVKGDDAWLSPFHGRDSCSIAVHAAVEDAHEYIVREATKVCRAPGGRPHWGKLHALAAADLATMYPRWDDFQRLRSQFDPRGRMLNAHLRTLLGAQ